MTKVRKDKERKRREEVGKKLCEGQSMQIKKIHANMPRDLVMAKFRVLKKPSIAKRGETERKVCKKMRKKGKPKWVVGTVLEQMVKKKDWWNEPSNPVARLGTAIQKEAYKVAQRKDLTKGEKEDTINKLIDQITEKHKVFESRRQAKRRGKKEETADDEDYEVKGDDDDAGGDDIAELMDVRLAYLEDEKERREKTEAEKLDITTGGEEATEDDYEEKD